MSEQPPANVSKTREKPTKKEVRFTRSWPFIEVREVDETRREHAMMFLVMVFCTAILVAKPSIPAASGVVTAFIGGYALSNWATFPQLYGE